MERIFTMKNNWNFLSLRMTYIKLPEFTNFSRASVLIFILIFNIWAASQNQSKQMQGQKKFFN